MSCSKPKKTVSRHREKGENTDKRCKWSRVQRVSVLSESRHSVCLYCPAQSKLHNLRNHFRSQQRYAFHGNLRTCRSIFRCRRRLEEEPGDNNSRVSATVPPVPPDSSDVARSVVGVNGAPNPRGENEDETPTAAGASRLLADKPAEGDSPRALAPPYRFAKRGEAATVPAAELLMDAADEPRRAGGAKFGPWRSIARS